MNDAKKRTKQISKYFSLCTVQNKQFAFVTCALRTHKNLLNSLQIIKLKMKTSTKTKSIVISLVYIFECFFGSCGKTNINVYAHTISVKYPVKQKTTTCKLQIYYFVSSVYKYVPCTFNKYFFIQHVSFLFIFVFA